MTGMEEMAGYEDCFGPHTPGMEEVAGYDQFFGPTEWQAIVTGDWSLYDSEADWGMGDDEDVWGERPGRE